jgi:hypothetical protein
MLNHIFLVLGYAFLGGGLKYIDQAYDENAFSKFFAKILAVLLGFIMGYLMAVDTYFSTAYLAAMIVGVFVAKKIDNFSFIIVVTGALFSLCIFSLFYSIHLSILPFLFFSTATFLDEICDEEAHRKKFNKHLRKFFQLRPLSDITLFGLILSGFFNWFYLLPYYAFFISYITVEKLSLKRLHNV